MMCTPRALPSYFGKPEKRLYLRAKRLHGFASRRWLRASTPGAAEFWKGIKDWCVKVETEWV